MDLAGLVHAGVVRRDTGLRHWLRQPAVHFIAIGALIFGLFGTRGDERTADTQPRAPIVVTALQVEQLLARYAQATGLRPTSDDARALVDRAIDEEVLYREALTRGLDQGDRGVRWRLIEKMTFLSDDVDPNREDLLAAAAGLGLDREDAVVRRILVEKMRLILRHAGSSETPDTTELQAWLDRHEERFAQPVRVRVSQVFLARDRHPGTLEADAGRLLAELRSDGVAPEKAVDRGDPFPLELRASVLSARELEARFGEAMSLAAIALPPGTWSDPIASVFGLHLVWVHERIPQRLPPLEEVRGPVQYGLIAERREAALAASLRALRDAYDVRIEWPTAVAAASSGGAP